MIGEQLVDAIGRVSADAEEDVAQVRDGVDVVGFASGDRSTRRQSSLREKTTRTGLLREAAQPRLWTVI